MVLKAAFWFVFPMALMLQARQSEALPGMAHGPDSLGVGQAQARWCIACPQTVQHAINTKNKRQHAVYYVHTHMHSLDTQHCPQAQS